VELSQVYYPYFRGKQFELLAIREEAPTMAAAGFIPIIEPVRESTGRLERALQAVVAAGGQAIVILNPRHGDHSENGDGIETLIARSYAENPLVSVGVLLRNNTALASVLDAIASYDATRQAVIHAGFTDARSVAESLGNRMSDMSNVFIEDQANMLYRRHLNAGNRVLLRDGFERKRNADYHELDSFSDLHATYRDLGMNGYGDFLTVGDNYSESGGPAYAVAIHLTFIDPDQDDAMFIYHFVSDTNDTPADPAAKFAQALAKLIARLNRGDSKLLETSAITEFRQLHDRGHFPGLGYVKKLSMKHHIETLADFHDRQPNA
jgi:hypothetical protein